MGPEEIARLTTAYEETLRTIGLVDRNDPITEMIARKIIEIGQRGVRDPMQLSELTIKEMGIS
jgi:DNA integrity scanning protein DisA with diadenylate cyclase activity